MLNQKVVKSNLEFFLKKDVLNGLPETVSYEYFLVQLSNNNNAWEISGNNLDIQNSVLTD